MDKYNAFTFVKVDLHFWVLDGVTFWLERISSGRFCEFYQRILSGKWFCSGVFNVLTYLLNLVSMRELKPTTVGVFIYLQPLLQHYYFRHKFRKRRFEFSKIDFGGVDICWSLFGNQKRNLQF